MWINTGVNTRRREGGFMDINGGGGGGGGILGFEIMTIQIFLGCVFAWIKIDSLGFDILDTSYFG